MKHKTKKILASCALSLPLLASSVLCPILAVKKASADVAVIPQMAWGTPLTEFDFILYAEEVDVPTYTYPTTFYYYDEIGALPSTIGQGDIYSIDNSYSLAIDSFFLAEVQEIIDFPNNKRWLINTLYDDGTGYVPLFNDQLRIYNESAFMLPIEDLERWRFNVTTQEGNVYHWRFSCEVYDTSSNEWYNVNVGATYGDTVELSDLFSDTTPRVTYRDTEFYLCRDFNITYELYHAFSVILSLESADNFSVSTDVVLAQDDVYSYFTPTIVEEIVPTPSEVFFGMVDDFLSTEFMPNFSFGDLCLIALGISAFFMFLKIWMGG